MEPLFIGALVVGILAFIFWLAVAINQFLAWQFRGSQTLDLSPQITQSEF